MINSHPGNFINFLIFLFLFSILNNYFHHLKNKFFYIFCILFLLIFIETIYFQIFEYIKYEENELNLKKIIQSPFTWKHYFASVLLPLNFSDWTSINRYPFYGIVFIFSFLQAVKILSKRVQKFFC